jgi:formyltetrahydrofolate deformylase
MHRYILTLCCPERIGIVAAVGQFLLEHRCNIVASAQFSDEATRGFLMRVCFEAESPYQPGELQGAFASIAAEFKMQCAVYDVAEKERVLLMVSKQGHCLNDLLYRYRIGALPIEIPAIVSNHRDFYRLAAARDIPYHYLPITPDNKPRQEEKLLELVNEERCGLIVLARYMQVISAKMCETLKERIINIHHSFSAEFSRCAAL